MKSWVLRDQFLGLDDGTALEFPPAMDVFRLVVRQTPCREDVDPGQHGGTSGLEFSAYPVLLYLELSDAPDAGLPVVTLSIQTQRGERHEVPLLTLEIGHVVADGTWYAVAADSLEDARAALASASADVTDGRLQTLRGLLSLKTISRSDLLVVDRTKAGATEAVRLAAAATGDPAGVKATLYPYQHDGWRWLRFIAREQLGGLLADEMGLGKTLQIISMISDPGDNMTLSPALVVAPGSLLENWRREIEKFAPHLKVLKHQGSLRTGRYGDLQQVDVVIASYDTVIRDQSMLTMIEWSLVVLDEAQNIKNPDALRTMSVKSLPRKVGLAMTGTPIENRLTDLWSIMDFAVPGYLGDVAAFTSTFSDDPDGGFRLEPLITPLMLRRTVREVANDLPERIDIPEVLELSDEEAVEYDRIRQEILTEHGKVGTLVSLTLLRQFCAHPAILKREGDRFAALSFSKFERLREILAEIFASSEKVIVFTSYTEMADRIRAMVEAEFGMFAATLDGRLSIDERQPLIDRFSAVEGSAALILNPKAGGAGLNITAANHVIHYNLEWNPALEDQASARAHRRGQDRPVTVRRLFCAGTVEEIVNDRVMRKRALSEATIIGVGGDAGDYEDIVAALERSPLKGR